MLYISGAFERNPNWGKVSEQEARLRENVSPR